MGMETSGSAVGGASGSTTGASTGGGSAGSVDTGSTDETVALARENGAVVHDICITPWRFDLARNAALALVIASSVLKEDAMAVPGALYGVLMYAGGLLFAFSMRRFTASEPVQARVKTAS